MPIHDWKPGFAWLFHHFHQEWIHALGRALNGGLLPPEFYAMTEQVTVGVEPDVLALRDVTAPRRDPATGGLLVAEPRTRVVETLAPPRRKNTVTVKHASDDRTVAVIEIVSPGNKDSRRALEAFVTKTVDLLAKGVHLLVIDLHPPTKRDPHGLHAAILEEVSGREFVPPTDKPLTLAAYEAAEVTKAYVEPVAVGDVLPDMPLFLVPGGHVLVPLERTYLQAWEGVPARWRPVIEGTVPAPPNVS
jgi:hypothetical protein